MDGLIQKITQGDAVALSLVKTALTTPTLINTDITQGTPYALPLECESYRQSSTAQVSESLVIIKNGKTNVTDNVAPGAWSWEMSGFIPGDKLLEPTNYFTPFVRLNTDIVKQWYKSGAVLQFKDMDAQLHKRVVIQNLTIAHEKDCLNMAPFSMTLKEINVMEDNPITSILDALNSPKAGTKLGAVAKVGVIMTAAVTTPFSSLF